VNTHFLCLSGFVYGLIIFVHKLALNVISSPPDCKGVVKLLRSGYMENIDRRIDCYVGQIDMCIDRYVG
jgi:hypothetical protein